MTGSYWPEPVSPTMRNLLCDLASGDLKRPLHLAGVDWPEAPDSAFRHGLLGLIHRYLNEGVSRESLPPSFAHEVEVRHRLSAVRLAMLYRQIEWVFALLAEANIAFLVIKGPAVAYTIYPHPSLRPFSDLDLVVRERDWARIHEALVGAGFVSSLSQPQPQPKIIPSAVRLEQGYSHPARGLSVEVHYDDLLNAGLASRDIEGFWERAVTVVTPTASFWALCPEDQLIQLCSHVHTHRYLRLMWLSDLAFLVRDHGHRLDWSRVVATVRREEAQVPVYFSLTYLQNLLGVATPEEVLEQVRPDALRLWLHERYVPKARVSAVSPIWLPYFGFYHTPFFARLVPDLLVMGRRKDKLHYLWRLLTPPREWLVFYYALSDSRWIGIHYLLHPLKLGYHILEELVAPLLIKSRAWLRSLKLRRPSSV